MKEKVDVHNDLNVMLVPTRRSDALPWGQWQQPEPHVPG